jgi:hypothetical protein
MPSPTRGAHTILAGAFGTSFTTAGVTSQATGSTFIVFYEGGNAPSAVPLDTVGGIPTGNVYTLATSNTAGAFGGNQLFVYVCQNGLGGASHAATVSIAPGSGNAVVGFFEVLGALSASLDQAASNGSNSSLASVSCPQVTTTAANELVVCFYGSNGQNTLTSITDSGSGFAISDSQLASTSQNGAISFAQVSAIGTYGDTFTQSTADFLSSATLSFFGTGSTSDGAAPHRAFRRPLRLGTPFSRLRSGRGSTDVSSLILSLTGQRITASAGTLSPALSFTLTGGQLTSTAGTVSPNSSHALTGQSVTSHSGTIGLSNAPGLAGARITSSAGTITASTGPVVTVNLTGVAIVSVAGNLSVAFSLPLSGVRINSAAGSIKAGIGPTLSGVRINSATGNLGTTRSITLNGARINSSTGTLFDATSLGLTGGRITASAGTLTASQNANVTVNLSGVRINSATGNLTSSGGTSTGGHPIGSGFICNVATLDNPNAYNA